LPCLLQQSAVRIHTNRLYYTPTGYITHQQAILYTSKLYYTPPGYITHSRLYYAPTGYITHQQAILRTSRLYCTPAGYITHQQAILHTSRLYYAPAGYITHQQAILHTNRLYYTPAGYITHQQAILHISLADISLYFSHFVYLKRIQTFLPEHCSQYGYPLRATQSGVRMPVEAKISVAVQTDPKAHPAPCTISTGYLFQE